MKTPVLDAVGGFVPDRVLTSRELEDRWDLSDGWIASRTGVKRRHVAEDLCTGDMAVRAGEVALRRSGCAPQQIDLLLLATSTPDKPLPPTAPAVQDRLGTTGGAFDIAGSCVGFLDALATATQYVQTGTHDHVLVIGANHLTYRLNWDDPETACLFGDGAGAAVVSAQDAVSESSGHAALQVRDVILDSDGSLDSLDVPAGGSREPFTPAAWENDRHLMRMKDGRNVFRQAVDRQVEIGRRLLAKHDVSPADLEGYAPHQANRKIIKAVHEQLDLPEGTLLSNIDRRGNTSAASIPLLLHDLRASNRLAGVHRILMTAFGCGVRMGAALLERRAP